MPKRPPPVPQTAPEDLVKKILGAIARVPKGRVSTYGGIARVAGLPGRARLVGTVLKNQPANARLPWFRVINASGRISLPKGSEAYREQRKRLEAEGVRFAKGRVDLKGYGWPQANSLDESLWGMEDVTGAPSTTPSKMHRWRRMKVKNDD